MPSQTTQGIRAQRKARRPAEILDAAFEEFVAHGFSAARVEDIADRVGVTKGTVYVYFDSKERLFRETVAHILASIRQDIEALADDLQGASQTERVERFIRSAYTLLGQHERRLPLIRLLIAEGPRFSDLPAWHQDQFLARLIDLIRRLIAEGVASGEFRSSAIERFPEILLSPVILFSISQLRSGQSWSDDLAAFVDAHVDLVLHGLRADP